jgi:hypothetical protein
VRVPETVVTGQTPAPRRRREILGPTGLVVMVAAILLFTLVATIVEVRSNLGARFRGEVEVGDQIREDAWRVVFHVTNTGTKPGRPDLCEATLLDLRGARAGTATIELGQPIPPGETLDVQAVGTVARPPVNGVVTCRSRSPS